MTRFGPINSNPDRTGYIGTVIAGDTTWDSLRVTSAWEDEYRINVEENVDELWDYYRMNLLDEITMDSSFQVISGDRIRTDAGDTDSTNTGGNLLFVGTGDIGQIYYTTDDASLLVNGPATNVSTGDTLWPATQSFTSYPVDTAGTRREVTYWVEQIGRVKTNIYLNNTFVGKQELVRWEVSTEE